MLIEENRINEVQLASTQTKHGKFDIVSAQSKFKLNILRGRVRAPTILKISKKGNRIKEKQVATYLRMRGNGGGDLVREKARERERSEKRANVASENCSDKICPNFFYPNIMQKVLFFLASFKKESFYPFSLFFMFIL